MRRRACLHAVLAPILASAIMVALAAPAALARAQREHGPVANATRRSAKHRSKHGAKRAHKHGIALGDWEGRSSQGPVSFQVIRRKGRLQIAHFVITTTTTCKNSNGSQRSSSPGTPPHPLPLSVGGSFRYGSTAATLVGHLRGSRAHGVWRLLAVTLPGILGEPATHCSTPPARWSAKPHRRVPVKDGKWSGSTADGQPVSFEVSAGGRIFSEFAVGKQTKITESGVYVTESETVNGKTRKHSEEAVGFTSEYPCWVSAPSAVETFVTWNGGVSVSLSTQGDPDSTNVPDLALKVSFEGGLAYGSYTPTGNIPGDACVAGSTFTAAAP